MDIFWNVCDLVLPPWRSENALRTLFGARLMLIAFFFFTEHQGIWDLSSQTRSSGSTDS